MARVNGLHHITAIAGPAQENLDFYAGARDASAESTPQAITKSGSAVRNTG